MKLQIVENNKMLFLTKIIRILKKFSYLFHMYQIKDIFNLNSLKFLINHYFWPETYWEVLIFMPLKMIYLQKTFGKKTSKN